MQRIVIYPSDLAVLEGINIVIARKKIRKLKEHFGIKNEGFLTIQQYCSYYNADYETYQKSIK